MTSHEEHGFLLKELYEFTLPGLKKSAEEARKQSTPEVQKVVILTLAPDFADALVQHIEDLKQKAARRPWWRRFCA